MKIAEIIWLDAIVEKLEVKHSIRTNEVVEVLRNRPRFRFVEKGRRAGEDVYAATGQTDSGRYLLVVFVYKTTRNALIVTARELSERERKQHGRK